MNYIVEGSDSYMVSDTVRKIMMEELGEYNEWNPEVFSMDETPVQEILHAAEQFPFLTDKKGIVVKNADLNVSAKRGKLKKDDFDRIMNYLEHPNETTVLLLDVSGNAPDGRSQDTKKLKKLCRYIKVAPLDQDTFSRMVKEDLKKMKVRLSPKAEISLMERLPVDAENWKTQSVKLMNAGSDITPEIIESLFTRNLFGNGEKDSLLFSNAILAKDQKKTMEYWKDISVMTKDYYSLIGLLASQFRFLYKVKYLDSRNLSKDAIANQLDVHPYRVQKTLETVHKYSLNDISEVMSELSKLDVDIKSGNMEDKLGFELFLLKVTGGSAWNR